MTTEYTENFRLNLPDFRMGPWHDLINTNTVTIDELLLSVLQGVDTRPWTNNTLFSVGMTAVDTVDNTFWVCSVTHTSAAVPTTFAQDRAAHPTYWARVVVGVAPRGEWNNSTHYLPNDMVSSAPQGVVAICITEHTSSAAPATIRTDQAYWSFIIDAQASLHANFIIYDNTGSGVAATNVQTALDLTFSNDATNKANTTTNTNNIASLTTRMTNNENLDTTQSANITTNTANIASVTGRVTTLENAGYITDAPYDDKQYARRNHAWSVAAPPSGISTINISDTPPANPLDNTFWLESDSGALFVRYNDGDGSQWIGVSGGGGATTGYVDTGDQLRVAKAGDTMTGDLHINKSAPSIFLDKTDAAGVAIYGTVAGSMRWRMSLGNTTAESGSNAGCDFAILGYSDAGVSLGVPALLLRRDSGNAQFLGSVTVGIGGSTGTYYFGNTNTKYLTYDGTNFNLVGGSLIVAANIIGIELKTQSNTTDGIVRFGSAGTSYLWYTGGVFTLNGGGLIINSTVTATGHACRAGLSGAYSGNYFNLNQPGVALWIDTTNVGNITVTSDYRIKKDVLDLPGMWDTVKGLRPIKYTQAEFSPPSHVKLKVEEALKARKEAEEKGEAPPPVKPDGDGIEPMFPADDIERWGFIAHELQATLIPTAATGVKDSPDHIQSPNPFTIIAALTKALQEAMTRIEVLESKIV